MGIKYALDGVPRWDENPSFSGGLAPPWGATWGILKAFEISKFLHGLSSFSLSFAFCFKAPTTCVVMKIAGTAGGTAVETVDAAGAGAADCTAAAEVVGVWLF